METATRRLLRALNPRKNAQSFLLPFVAGQRFDTTAVAVAAADLVEKLCYERFFGCVYFQHDAPDGSAQHGVVAIADDAILGALWVSDGAQTTGEAAWKRIQSLDFLPECLAIETSRAHIEAYATLLSEHKPANAPADEGTLSDAIESFVLRQHTGVIRVTDESRQWFEFWHEGAALGLYQGGDGGSYLSALDEDWPQIERTRRARLDVWRAQSKPVWVSPLAFSARENGALCELIGTAHDLASALAPAAQVEEMWRDALCEYPNLKLEAVAMNSPRRARELESVLKEVGLPRAQFADQIQNLVDDFLRPWAGAVGNRLFAMRAALAFSDEQKEALGALDIELQTIDLSARQSDDAPTLSAPKRLVRAIDALRFKAAPRRNLAHASSFDF